MSQVRTSIPQVRISIQRAIFLNPNLNPEVSGEAPRCHYSPDRKEHPPDFSSGDVEGGQE